MTRFSADGSHPGSPVQRIRIIRRTRQLHIDVAKRFGHGLPSSKIVILGCAGADPLGPPSGFENLAVLIVVRINNALHSVK